MKKIIALAIAAGISSAALAAPETHTIPSAHPPPPPGPPDPHQPMPFAAIAKLQRHP